MPGAAQDLAHFFLGHAVVEMCGSCVSGSSQNRRSFSRVSLLQGCVSFNLLVLAAAINCEALNVVADRSNVVDLAAWLGDFEARINGRPQVSMPRRSPCWRRGCKLRWQ